MRTTQGEAVKAFGVLTNMDTQQISSLVAYKLFLLKKALNTVVEFQIEQEKNLATQCGGRFNELGNLDLPSMEKRIEYAEKHRELERLECEINYERFVLILSELPKLTIRDIESLDPFIDFKE